MGGDESVVDDRRSGIERTGEEGPSDDDLARDIKAWREMGPPVASEKAGAVVAGNSFAIEFTLGAAGTSPNEAAPVPREGREREWVGSVIGG